MQHTHWCFTWYGHDEPGIDRTQIAPRQPGPIDEERVRYAVWQLERGSKNQKLHWQCYVELFRNARMRGAQKAVGLPKGTHAEGRRGTRDEAKAYCTKTRTRVVEEKMPAGPFEFGRWIEDLHPGRRTDLDSAVDCKTIREIKEKCPTVYVKYHRGLEKLITAKPIFGIKPEVWILWGEGTGTGKSRSTTKIAEDGLVTYYKKDAESKWWDGYDGQDLVHIDEYGAGSHEWMTANIFKQMFDWGPQYIWKKGETRQQFTSKYVVITSNKDPKTWYPTEKWSVIERRINKIIYCGAEDNKCEDRLSELRHQLNVDKKTDPITEPIKNDNKNVIELTPNDRCQLAVDIAAMKFMLAVIRDERAKLNRPPSADDSCGSS